MAVGCDQNMKRPWPVLALCCVLGFTSLGIVYGLGAMFTDLLDVFQTSHSAAGLVQSTCTGFAFSSCIVVGPFLRRFGSKATIVLGSLLGSAGCVIAFLAPNIVFVIVGMGALLGAGASCNFLTSQVLAGTLFQDMRSLAVSCVGITATIASAVFPPILRYLVDTYALRGTFLVLAGIELQMVVLGFLTHTCTPRGQHQDQKEDQNQAEERGGLLSDQGDVALVEVHQDSAGDGPQDRGVPGASAPIGNRPEDRAVHVDSAVIRNNSRDLSDTSVPGKEGVSVVLVENGGSSPENSTDGAELLRPKDTLGDSANGAREGERLMVTFEVEGLPDAVRQNSEDQLSWAVDADEPSAKLLTESPQRQDGSSEGGSRDDIDRIIDRNGKDDNENHASSCRGPLPVQTETHRPQEGTGPTLSFSSANGGERDLEGSSGHTGGKTSLLQRLAVKLPWLQLEVLQNRSYLMFLLSVTVFISVTTPLLFLTDMARDSGLSVDDGSFFLSLVFAGNLAGRVLSGVLGQFLKQSVPVVFPVVVLALGISCFAFAFTESFEGYVAASLVYGLCYGLVLNCLFLTILELLGPSHFALGLAYMNLFLGMLLYVNGPLGGAIRDQTGSYRPMFYLSLGHTMLASALLLFIVLREKKKAQSEAQ